MDPMDSGELRGRIAWLNSEGGFNDALVEDKVDEAARGVPAQKTDKILKDLEQHKDGLRDPTAWVTTALRKAGRGGGGGGGGGMRMADSYGGGGGMMMGGDVAIDAEMKKVKKRIGWLNSQGGFEGSIIYDKVMAAAGGLPFPAVLDVLRELENKKDGVKDPNAWVCSALRKAGGGGGGQGGGGPPPGYAQHAWAPAPPGWGAPPPMAFAPPGGRQLDPAVDQKIRKRVFWLNENAGLNQDLNYQKVSEAATGLQLKEVMDILKDVEGKASDIKDPTAYVTTGLRKRGGGNRGGGGAAFGGMYDAPPPMPNWGAPAPGGWSNEAEAEDKKLRRRIGWLNKDGGFNGAIKYDKVLEAAGGLEFAEVFRMLKEVEEKKESVRDPNAFVCSGLKRKAGTTVGSGPPRAMMQQAWGPPPGMQFAGAPPAYGDFMDDDTKSKLHKRIKWLNGTGGFNDAILFDKVKEAAAGVEPMAMMKVLKDLEEKKDQVKDPTAYVSSALRKLGGRGGMPGVRRTINKVKREV